VPHKGIGYGVLRYLSAAGAPLASAPEPQLTFNYLGQLDAVLDGDETFSAAREPSGVEHSPLGRRRSRLELNCMVHGGRLQLDWEYSPELHAEAQMQRLAEDHVARLRALIELSQSGKASPVTSSDFKHIQIEAAELDELLEDLG
jgi:non-ribosomal peptide synthase protein (TIGR01720 family)